MHDHSQNAPQSAGDGRTARNEPTSPYRDRIERLAPGYDPRVIECWMRFEHSTLDHLSPQRFAAEVRIAKACADEAGPQGNADLLKSYGI